MKACERCKAANPDTAHYCMQCGQPLVFTVIDDEPASRAGFGTLALSLLASLALSFVLMFVFRLPVFLVFGFLPLLWWRKR